MFFKTIFLIIDLNLLTRSLKLLKYNNSLLTFTTTFSLASYILPNNSGQLHQFNTSVFVKLAVKKTLFPNDCLPSQFKKKPLRHAV